MMLTLNSTDESSYNRIHVTIPAMTNTHYVNVTVTNLTCNCEIVVLSEKDYLRIQTDRIHTIQFSDYSNLSAETVRALLELKFAEAGIKVDVGMDACSRLIFASKEEFAIIEASYNVKMLMGLYTKKDDEFPLRSEKKDTIHVLKIDSVGFFLSTPILYLLSNIGCSAFRNDSNDGVNLQSCSTAMRINNSFTKSMPIIASNGEFSQTVPSNAVTGSQFILVDANLHEVKLLSPMYISIHIEPADKMF